MLAIIGLCIVALILLLLLTQRVNPIVALAGVPLLGALVAGFALSEISDFAMEGIGSVVGVVAMFVFAIIFFGVLKDAGMFDPIVDRITRFAGNAPVTVTLATTLLALVSHLDGAGASTFLITIPAMLPIYERLGMSRLVLATCTALGAGVMNLLPWGGPTLRAATTTGMDVNDLWAPLIPAQAFGVVLALVVAYWLGVREKRRLARMASGDSTAEVPESTGRAPRADLGDEAGKVKIVNSTAESTTITARDPSLTRPDRLWINVILALTTVTALVWGVIDPAVCFIVGAILALVINYPKVKHQADRINAHAPAAVLMAGTLLAAGVLLGVLEHSGMIEAMATSGAGLLPEPLAPALPLLAGILGVPLSLIFGPDAYYFGVMPVMIGVGEQFGVAGADIARGSILGQETVGFPISPMTGSFYLLVGLARVDIGRHIRHTFGWLWLISVLMVAFAVLTGVIPAWA